MKTEIFTKAISNRNRMQILYGFEENLFEPYYLSLDNKGRKVVFGRLNNFKFPFPEILTSKSRDSPAFNFVFEEKAMTFEGIRFTGVMRKIDGKWRLVQQHLSIPAVPEMVATK